MDPATISFPLPIITPRLLMRQPVLNDSDIQEYLKVVTESFDDLRPWMAWARYYPTFSQAEEYIRQCCSNWIARNDNNIGLVFWIVEKATSTLIGNITIWNIAWDVPKFEFGYWERTSYTHHGYITEAVNALTRYCFLQIGVNRIEIRCEVNNIRSQLVPQRLGFHLDGVLRNNVLAVATGQLTDTLVFSRIDLNGFPDLEVNWDGTEKS